MEKAKLVNANRRSSIFKAVAGNKVEAYQGISQGVANTKRSKLTHPISKPKLSSE
jgi:hypothetical protein